jgi:hypothetical protein
MRHISILVLALVAAGLLAFGFHGDSINSEHQMVAGIIGLLVAYFFPTLVLFIREAGEESGRTGFFLGNLMGAWTVIGWVILLIVALTAKRPFSYKN